MRSGFIERVSECDVGERGWQGIDWLVKHFAECDVGKIGACSSDGLVIADAEGEVRKRVGEGSERHIKSFPKSNAGDGRGEVIDVAVKIASPRERQLNEGGRKRVER